MNLVFMGTPAFALPTLAALLQSEHKVVAVYTQPDKSRGRGHQVGFSPVKEMALAAGVPVLQPASLKTPEALADFKALEVDLCVVVAYGKILPDGFLAVPPLGLINGHASLLPRWRGAGPIQWAILAGDRETGITAMNISPGMDEGDILLANATPIEADETAGGLSERLSVLCAVTLMETIGQIQAGVVHKTPQSSTGIAPTYAPMLQKEMANLDFSKPAQELHNQIRGLNPWPVARFAHGGKWVKVFASRVAENPEVQSPPGFVLAGGGLLVACGQGTALALETVQVEGKKPIHGEEFCRGYRLVPGTILASSSKEEQKE